MDNTCGAERQYEYHGHESESHSFSEKGICQGVIFPSQPPGLYLNYIEMDGSAMAGGAQCIKYQVSDKHSAWDLIQNVRA